jgi:transposase
MEEGMIRMDEFNKIRKDYFIDKLSINEIAIKFNRSWATVRKIVNTSRDEFSVDEKKMVRTPKVGTQEVIDAIADKLKEELRSKVKKKQRVTAKIIFEELTAKGLYHGSQKRMQELVKEVREKLHLTKPESFLPLEFVPGSTAQVDHGEVECIIDGDRRICFLFVMAIPGTGLRYCQLFAVKSQEAWGEFHERAFRFFNGIFSRVIYDNDTVLVKSLKEKRLLTNFGLHLIEHYGFDSNFCNPAAGNEKGSVENNVGFCRRNYLSGCPVFIGTQQANIHLEDKCREAIANDIHFKLKTSLSSMQAKVEDALYPLLPAKKWRRWLNRQVNSYQQINVDGHGYSVPEKYVLAMLKVGLSAESVEIFDGETLIVIHRRQFILGKDSLVLDHYLDQLGRKPGALWDCKAIQEIANDDLLLLLWEKLMSLYPGLIDHNTKLRTAQTTFIDILRLRRNYPDLEWRNGIREALQCGSTTAASIECIIRGIHSIEAIKTESKVVFINSKHHGWECDLSSYETLVQAEVLC